jgi:hypothetical protein
LEATKPPLAIAGADDFEGYRSLDLTDFTFEVMAEAAAAAESNPGAVSELRDRAASVVARLVASRRACGEDQDS